MGKSSSSGEGGQDQSSHLEPCPECQRLLSPRAHFCPGCGFPFESELSPEEVKRYDPGGLVDMCQVLAMLLLFGCILAIGALFCHSSPSGTTFAAAAGLILFAAPIAVILWTQATQLEWLAEIRRGASRRRKPAVEGQEARRRPLHENPEDRRAAQKLCSVLLEHVACSRQVEMEVEIELTAPELLGSAEAKEWRDKWGLQVIDCRPSYQVMFKTKVKRLCGRIDTSRVLDLARSPQVRTIRVG